jgi:hypothetical protein
MFPRQRRLLRLQVREKAQDRGRATRAAQQDE